MEKKTETQYTTKQVCEAALCTEIDLQNWIRRDLLSVPLSLDGSGKPRKYYNVHAVDIALLATFARLGVDLKKAKLWNGELYERMKSGNHAPYIAWRPGDEKPTVIDNMKTPIWELSKQLGSEFTFLNIHSLMKRVEEALDSKEHSQGSTHEDNEERPSL